MKSKLFLILFSDSLEVNSNNNLSNKQITNSLDNNEPINHDFGIYVMDAHYKGNVSRFYNHSCSPNVFVQNVFLDTWDVRFPWVAFFTATSVKAGTELVWDYSYEVKSFFSSV